MNEEYISVGRILRVYGTEGWVRVEMYSGRPDRLDGIRVVFLEAPGEPEGKIIQERKIDDKSVLLKFKDGDTREQARQLVGKEILLPENQKITLPRDTYFIHDLIGLEVFTDSGEYVGQLAEVFQMSGNDVYLVRGKDREVLIPAVGEFIREVKVNQGKMIVRLLEGM
jgi:16S rRNA processing protein RimM